MFSSKESLVPPISSDFIFISATGSLCLVGISISRKKRNYSVNNQLARGRECLSFCRDLVCTVKTSDSVWSMHLVNKIYFTLKNYAPTSILFLVQSSLGHRIHSVPPYFHAPFERQNKRKYIN